MFPKIPQYSSAVLSGESADVNQDSVDDWVQRLPSLCEGFEPQHIFNADETVLFLELYHPDHW